MSRLSQRRADRRATKAERRQRRTVIGGRQHQVDHKPPGRFEGMGGGGGGG
jgi:hypothetical protein